MNNQTPAPDWLRAVLYSGEVTRVAQHLALVLFHIAGEDGVLHASLRELEAITGWSRQTLSAHLDELRLFVSTTRGHGRGKSTFELQCQITDALKEIRVSQQVTNTKERDHGRESVKQRDTKMVKQPDTTAVVSGKTVNQPDTTAPPSRARIVSSLREDSPTLEKDSPFFPQDHEGARFEKGRLVLLNGVRQFWLGQFGGNDLDLDLALIQAAGYVQENSRRPLEAQVGAQLAQMVRRRREQDQRYSAAVKQNQTKSNPSAAPTSDALKQIQAIVGGKR